MGLIAEQQVIAQLVQQEARKEAFLNENTLEIVACQAVERIFARVEELLKKSEREFEKLQAARR